MKVGVMTFHDGINHGGFFQALCLSKYIQSLGYECEILNYKTRKHWLNEYAAFLVKKNVFQVLKNIKKIGLFKSEHSKLSCFPASLTTSEEKIKSIAKDYDYIVYGSDIIWDYQYGFTGDSSIYFGEGMQPKIANVSYAASMGRVVDDRIPEKFGDLLSSYKAIGVRDDNTKAMVESSSHKAVKVVDPTLLVGREDIESYMGGGSDKPLVEGKYMLIYAFHFPEEYQRKVKAYASANGLKLVAVGYPVDCAEVNMTEIGPSGWLNLFDHAESIVTSTFHGTIFAIHYRKPFLTIANPAIKHKAGSLLKDLELTSRYREGDLPLEKLHDEIYGSIDEKLACVREPSREFLAQALSS